MIEYVEPGEHGELIVVRISEEAAIVRSKAAAAQHLYTYKSDQEALDDFIVVNWATRVVDDLPKVG